MADFAGERGSNGARGYGPQNLTPKGPGRVAGAHRGLDRRRWPVQSVGVEARWRDSGGAGNRRRGPGGARTKLGGGVEAGALRAPGWHGSTQGCPAGRIRGQGGSGATGGEKLQWRCLPAAAILAEGCGGAGGSGVGLWARCRWDAQGDAGWSLKKRAR